MKLRRRLGLLLFGLVLVLLKKPAPNAHCGNCGFVTSALCTECLNQMSTGVPQ